MHDLHSSQRQCTFLQNLRLAIFGRVFHRNDDAPRTGDEVHCATHALHHFSGNHPIGEIAVLVDFHCAQHAKINMAATNHRERVRTRKIRCPGEFAHRLLAGVDEVGIFLAFHRIRADAEHAIFALQNDIHSRWDVIRNKRGHADAEIHVEPIAQFARDPLYDAITLLRVFGLRFGFGFDCHIE